MGGVKVMLKHVLDTDADSAWRALQSPAVFREVMSPLLSAASLDPGGFRPTWGLGSHQVAMDALGILPMGAQEIDLSYRRVPSMPAVRILRDNGGPLTGSLRLITAWDHRMAVAPLPDGRTLFRDKLEFSAGLATAALWPSMWAFWQWRGLRIQALAPSWRHDVGADARPRGEAAA
ncbi:MULTISPECIES: hypothetical protein [unclassified Rathayibacter]|uniref:hypothetical protein n=1 Tax=unclassified Rathayibacter TaxID=2609250 RepID=UPI001E2ED41C|nr:MULTISPECIES: hypothetical protein [unclassified Rathayibacter]